MGSVISAFSGGSEADEYPYEAAEKVAEHIRSICNLSPQVGIICDSDLDLLGDKISHAVTIEYSSIPTFPTSTVPGHAGCLIFGCIEGVPVIVMQGRFHYYEGYSLKKTTLPVRVMQLMGVNLMIVTNATCGINPDYKVGDIMFIRDHLNMLGIAGNSPLRGPNDDRWGTRFPPLTNAFTPEYLVAAKKVIADMGITDICHEGIYVGVGGPTYETIAEMKALRAMGGDAVGMSMVDEVIVAAYCGISVMAFSLITSTCSLDYEQKEVANHKEIVEVCKQGLAKCGEFVVRLISELAIDGA